jgi:hypothetical protein
MRLREPSVNGIGAAYRPAVAAERQPVLPVRAGVNMPGGNNYPSPQRVTTDPDTKLPLLQKRDTWVTAAVLRQPPPPENS